MPKLKCSSCPVGAAMGEGSGGHCPLLEETVEAGSFVFEAGDPARSSWFLKSGVVRLVEDSRSDGLDLSTNDIILQAPQEELAAGFVQNGVHTVSALALTKVSLCRKPVSWGLAIP